MKKKNDNSKTVNETISDELGINLEEFFASVENGIKNDGDISDKLKGDMLAELKNMSAMASKPDTDFTISRESGSTQFQKPHLPADGVNDDAAPTDEQLKHYHELYDFIAELTKKYADCADRYEQVKATAAKTVMTKGGKASELGMFVPAERLKYIFGEYTGKITDNAKGIDHKYYFDEDGKLLATERYNSGKIGNTYVFYYEDDRCDIVLLDKFCGGVAKITLYESKSGVPYRCVTANTSVMIMGINEYFYDPDDVKVARRITYLDMFDKLTINEKVEHYR